MTIRLRLSAAVVAAFVGAAGAANASTLINFDDVVGGGNISTPTNVSGHYAALGVTFADPAGPAGAVLASVPKVPTSSLPNIFFANQQQTNGDSGDLQVNFTKGVSSIDLDVFLSNGFYLAYFARGASGLLTSGSLPMNAFYGQPQHLSLTSGPPIRQLVLTSHPASNHAIFANFSMDNLSFTEVPEPGTWAMMVVGLGGLGVVVRRRRGTA